MVCKKCGAQIRGENRRADGLYECPECGTLYRAKPKAKPDAPSPARGAKRPARGGGRINGRRVAIAAVALAVLIAAIVAAALALARGGGEDRVAPASATVAATVRATTTATPAPTAAPKPPATAHLRAVGDVMSHKLQLTHARQKDGSYDYSGQFEYVKDALSKADYTIANLELSIAVDREYSSYPFFRAPEAILDALNDSGVDLLTMANNHILDSFFEGLTHTIDAADARGFDHVGAYRTAQEAAQPLVVDINGIRFGFLAYTEHVNDNDKRIDADKAAFCVKRLDDADFAADVRALRELGAEVVVCLPHWGVEGKRSVDGSCKKYAQQMVEAGVDIILGSHPHVVLPIQQREMDVNGEKKDVLIAWSMGNFISYMAAQYMDSGIIVDFTVERDEAGKIHIRDVGYVPVYVWGNKNVFHLICSGDFYSKRPKGMSDHDFKRMKQSVKEIVGMIGQDDITLLAN